MHAFRLSKMLFIAVSEGVSLMILAGRQLVFTGRQNILNLTSL